MLYRPEWAHLSPLRPELIPENGVEQVFIRFLLEDSYFGTADLREHIPEDVCQKLGIKLLHEVVGNEEIITELAYYRRSTLENYFRIAFQYARQKGYPLICFGKWNIMSRYKFWRKICERIHRDEFPDVEFRKQLIDSGNGLLFNPKALHGVLVGGNEHFDIVSDGAAAGVASLGTMYSSAVNPDTNAAMFESGAGTSPTLAGKDLANPIGRTLAGAMMLRHIKAEKGASAIEKAVDEVLKQGYRTADIISQNDDPQKILGTRKMGEIILSNLS